MPKLIFDQDEFKGAFSILNKSNSLLIFKIKSTSVKSIDIQPFIGSINPWKSFNVSVTKKEKEIKNVKIQINYTECLEAFYA